MSDQGPARGRRVDFYAPTYRDFAADIYAQVRARAFGEDIGQTSWLTADEQDRIIGWLALAAGRRLLDVACGSGGPTLRIARRTACDVEGIDVEEQGVRTATRQAEEAGLAARVTFRQADAGGPLPYADASFDAIVCVDAINHLPDRHAVLSEWRRLLRPGGRVAFTDPIMVTGPITNEEAAIRSSIGFFLFTPPGYNEAVLAACGFEDVAAEDRTANMARIARAWWEAREAFAADLRKAEGETTFQGQQRFLDVAARLAEERRLSRWAFHARRGDGDGRGGA